VIGTLDDIHVAVMGLPGGAMLSVRGFVSRAREVASCSFLSGSSVERESG
jgi:hypothetical protein